MEFLLDPLPLLWLALSIICIILVLAGLNKALSKTGASAANRKKWVIIASALIEGWVILLAVLAFGGFFADFTSLPPRPVLAILIPLPIVLLFSFSKRGTALLYKVPQTWLIGMQSFRIAVELLIWLAFIKNVLPVQMTFEGRNFDILSGVLALVALYWLLKQKGNPKKIIFLYNIIGMALLLNILIIALFSMPTPFRHFMNEPSNIIITKFPYIMLPGVLVPLAYTLHIFSLRKLFLEKS